MVKRLVVIAVVLANALAAQDFSNLNVASEILGPRLGAVRGGEHGTLYLLPAYRALTGQPLTRVERDSLRQAWPDYDANDSSGTDQTPAWLRNAQNRWIAEWMQIGGKPPQDLPWYEGAAEDTSRHWPDGMGAPGVYKNTSLAFFLNCPIDAFHTAVLTYIDRKRRYASDEELAAWVAAQQQVFDNCSDKAVHMPQELLGGSPLARADREYQRAAARLYSGQYLSAAAAFEGVAHDAHSPWQEGAPYLAARAWVRAADNTYTIYRPVPPAVSRPGLLRAQTLLTQLLRDRTRAEWWPAARRLQAYVAIRLDPLGRAEQLAQLLSRPGDDTFGQDLVDLTTVAPRACAASAPAPTNDYLAWYCDLRTWDRQATAYGRWRKTHSPAWLVAALDALRDPAAPDATALLAAANAVPPLAPAYDSVLTEKLRIELLRGDDALARNELARADWAGMPEATRNLMQAIAFASAATMPDLARSAPRRDGNRIGYDDDALRFLTHDAPLVVLEQFTQAEAAVPWDDRPTLLPSFAVWTRELLLDAPDTDAPNPAFADFAPYVAAYRAASSVEQRHFVAALLFLHFPGLSPGIGNASVEGFAPLANSNWWRAPGDGWNSHWGPWWEQMPTPYSSANAEYAGSDLARLYPHGFHPPPFLTAAMAQQAAVERSRLGSLGLPVNLFCRWVLAWVQAHPDEPRAAEALSLAVRATQRSEGDNLTAGLSKACFDFLHQHYGSSAWAQQTPQWYSGYEY